MPLPWRRRHQVRREILQHQRDHACGERGRPAPGAVTYSDGLAFRFVEQRRRLVLCRTQYLIGGALPYPVGLRTRLCHDFLGLPCGFPSA